MNKLQSNIYKIGRKLAMCQHTCDKVFHDQKKGILPRCLYYENNERNCRKRGVVIIGINPGGTLTTNKKYLEYAHKSNNHPYEVEVAYWEKMYSGTEGNHYYAKMRRFINHISIQGPIVWTELVKCQCSVENTVKDIPLDVYRKCVSNYFLEELSYIPPSWTIIAAAKNVYEKISFLCHDRKILGIPHPTSSHGQFERMMKNSLQNIINQIATNKNWSKEVVVNGDKIILK